MKYSLAIKLAIVTTLSITSLIGCSLNTENQINTDIINTDSNENTTDDVENIQEVINPKDIIIADINNLLAGDRDTVIRYFGMSDVYTSDAVRDRLSIAKINFINIEDTDIDNFMAKVSESGTGNINLTVHICTLDYNKTKYAIEELRERLNNEQPGLTEDELNEKVTREIAARAQNSEFDLHISLPVQVSYEDWVGKLRYMG